MNDVEQEYPDYQYTIRRDRNRRWTWTVMHRDGDFYNEAAHGTAMTRIGAKNAAERALRRILDMEDEGKK